MVMFLDGGHGCGFNLESEAGGESNSAQHAQMVFFKTLLRNSDRSNDAVTKIAQSSDGVDHLGIPGIRGIQRSGIQQQRVDRKVAAQHVLFRICLEGRLYRGGAVSLGMIAAECRSLHAVSQDDSELRAYELSLGKDLYELIGPSVGRDVVVLRFASKQEIGTAAAHQPRLESTRAKF